MPCVLRPCPVQMFFVSSVAVDRLVIVLTALARREGVRLAWWVDIKRLIVTASMSNQIMSRRRPGRGVVHAFGQHAVARPTAFA
jgi:hypothetical protein